MTSRTENFSSFINSAISSRLKDLHTCLPAIVESFDPVTQTLEIQPAISRIYSGGKEVPLPKLINVPLVTLQTAQFSITMPVKAGDECLVIFSERSIDAFYKTGEVSPPNDLRFHDLSDGFAILGISSEPNVITNYDPDNVEIRNADASVAVTLKPTDEIIIKAPTKITLDTPLVECTGDVKDSKGTMDSLRENYNTAQYIGNLGNLTSTTNKVDG